MISIIIANNLVHKTEILVKYRKSNFNQKSLDKKQKNMRLILP